MLPRAVSLMLPSIVSNWWRKMCLRCDGNVIPLQPKNIIYIEYHNNKGANQCSIALKLLSFLLP